ncbi:MAG: hypothetical protein ABT01_04870 [Clostridium sp. SCN 57-10]|nr:MAG: hypothetical protein ABT01_04870 [Clostridium sp. SCN 57-10]
MKKILPETLLEYQFVSDPRLSPDGTRTAFTVKQADEKKNSYRSDLWLVCNETGKTRRLTAQGDAGAYVWTREGKLLFTAPRGEKHAAAQALCAPSTTYFEIDPDGGEAVAAFTLPIAGGAPRFLANGKAAIIGRVDLNRPDFEHMDDSARKRAIEDYQKPGFHIIEEIPFWQNGGTFSSRVRDALFLCDTMTETATLLTAPRFTVWGVDVSGDRVVYSGVAYDDVLPAEGGLYLYENGETRALLPEGEYEVGAFRFVDSDTVIAALIEKDAHTYAMPNLYRVDLANGALTKIADWDGSVGSASVASDARLGSGMGMKACGGKVYFVSTWQDEGVLFSVDRDGKIEEINMNAGSIDAFDVQDGKMVLCALRGDRMPELYMFENGAERRLTGLNDRIYEEYSVVTPEPTRFTATDGFEIHGWVMPPVGYVKGQKYPCIFHIHGGPATVFGSVFHNEMQMWANAGYFVIYCNPRGGDGRGLEFVDLYHKYGTVDYDNLMEFVDHCIALYPDIDTDNLGVTGGSYGGFMTNLIIGRTDRFKAAATQRSIANWLSFEGISDIGYWFGPCQHGASVATDPEYLWDISPLKYIKNIKTPTLLIHSDADYRCWMSEALQFFTALKMHDVPTRLVLFHGECHDLSRTGTPRNRIRRMEEIIGWMNQYLKA